MIMKLEDRRKFHRIDFDGKVSLQFYRNTYEYLQVRDLSLTGMFVVGGILQRKMENCHITIFHKEKTGNNCLRATGELVWGNGKGVGLRFTQMSVEDYILLQTTLIHHAEEPEVLLREFPKDCPFEISG